MDYCLIHLSDFHLRTSTQLETDEVLKSLTGDLKRRIQELGLPDPHVALSGDLAYGGREEEYSIVDGFVDSLREMLHARRMVYCGGNHDVNWSLLAPFNAELMNNMVEKRGGVAGTEARFGDDADRVALKNGMGPYYSFLEKHGLKSTDNLFYVDSVDVADVRLNYICRSPTSPW